VETPRFRFDIRPRTRALALLAAIVVAATTLTAAVAPAIAAEQPTAASTLDVDRRGDNVQVRAQAEVSADLHTVWKTLSDYDHLQEFIPGMSLSRTVSRSGAAAIVEQQGDVGLGPFRRGFSVRLIVQETLDRSISARGIGGDFRRFESLYEIEPLGANRTRIVYRALLQPELPVPAAIGVTIMRSMIREQFDALVREVERRAAA
jgi:carbon monoxide dehydrogenase subunit G